MYSDFLLMGMVIGFSIAAPIGPVGILCVRRTLAEGRIVGFASGLGAATADLLYACIAGFGLSVISNLLLGYQLWLHVIGGVFLVCLGLWTLVTQPSRQQVTGKGEGLIRAYSSTFFLTLTNPVTIILFAGFMAGFGAGSAGNDYFSTTILVLGVFIGSILWWAILVIGIGTVQNKFNSNAILWVNRISGVIIIGFGIAALANWI
jgi:threonine/homoserine/homoserine lactone efflux protein